jgi:hypothetical protein
LVLASSRSDPDTNRTSSSRRPVVEFESPLSLAALGFLAGTGGFFAPCAFALFPAYVSYYLDLKHGGDAGLEELQRGHGRLPITVECRTGGGGRHLYLAQPGGPICNRVGLAQVSTTTAYRRDRSPVPTKDNVGWPGW